MPARPFYRRLKRIPAAVSAARCAQNVCAPLLPSDICSVCRGLAALRLRASRFDLALAVARMAMEGSGRGKFSKLMANHIFSAIDRDKLMAVMHCEGQADHIRYDHRAARPGADYPLVPGGARDLDLLLEMG